MVVHAVVIQRVWRKRTLITRVVRAAVMQKMWVGGGGGGGASLLHFVGVVCKVVESQRQGKTDIKTGWKG